MVPMDEEVFLVFVSLGIAIAAMALIFWILRLLPPGGWLLLFARFPNFHGVEASPSRLPLAGPSPVGLGP